MPTRKEYHNSTNSGLAAQVVAGSQLLNQSSVTANGDKMAGTVGEQIRKRAPQNAKLCTCHMK